MRLAFNNVVNLKDCWLCLYPHLLQDSHKFSTKGIKLSLIFENVNHLQVLSVAIANVIQLSIWYPFTNFCKSTDDLIVFGRCRTIHLNSNPYFELFLSSYQQTILLCMELRFTIQLASKIFDNIIKR